MLHLITAAFAAILTLSHAPDIEVHAAGDTPLAGKPLEPFAPFLGTWEIKATWSSGEELHAFNTYTPIMNGAFVEASTKVSDNNGPLYVRYKTIFAHHKETNTIVAHGFTYDGSVSEVTTNVEKQEDVTVIESSWNPNDGPVTIRQRVETIDNDSYSWKVWVSAPNDPTTWNQLMDGVWKRLPDHELAKANNPENQNGL